jgi:hypothetical protein
MLTVYTAPEPLDAIGRRKPSLFLGGTIEQGTADDWQARACSDCAGEEYVFLNPRRAEWDAGLGDGAVREQVRWELDAIGLADAVLVNLLPGTLSPISLLELGLCCGERPPKLVVVCPEGFWRRANVEVTCERYGVPLHADFGAGLAAALALARGRGRFFGGE